MIHTSAGRVSARGRQMSKPIVILGAGGFARETLDIIDAVNAVQNTFECLGFVLDAQYGQAGDIINEYPILGDFSWLSQHDSVLAVCGVGSPEIRRKMVYRTKELGVRFATLIHPTAIITRWVSFGEGCVVTAGCIFTNQITVGSHVHVNLDCTVGHDVRIDDFVTISPGVHVSGNVHLQEGCYVGTGANIIEKRTIGSWSIIGSGSTVVKDVEPNTTVVGVPAQMIKTRDEGWHLR